MILFWPKIATYDQGLPQESMEATKKQQENLIWAT